MDYTVVYPPPPPSLPPPPPDQQMNSFGYGLGISIGVIFLITTITLVSYFCTRTVQPVQRGPLGSDVVLELGLDQDTLSSYPKLPFSEAKLRSKDSTSSSCCSICLGDYKEEDLLRLLPDCDHLFHARCVDPWLLRHPTCPVCRSSPVPTPLSTPLADVVPIRMV